jgi:hypothetical protein
MRRALVVIFLAVSAFAEPQSAGLPASCGAENARFDIKLDKPKHTLSQADPEKALVYFIQDKGKVSFGIGGALVTTIGLDGAWVGANKNNSYFSVLVEPGEHKVCLNWRSNTLGDTVEIAHFTAEVGKIYYFRERYVYGGNFFLGAADSDEAQYLIASYPLSVSQPKK